MTLEQMLSFFFIYGLLGWCVEVTFEATMGRGFINRGFLNGPICPIYGVGVTLVVGLLMPFRHRIILLYVVSVVLVTTLEGLTGWIMEKVFHHKWWDYSDKPWNIKGYVCLPFSLIWGVGCVLIIELVHPAVAWMVGEVPLFISYPLLGLLSASILADLIVTVAGVQKMNRNLRYMKEVGEELHKISDSIGEAIYNGVMEILEQKQETTEKFNEVKKYLSAHISTEEISKVGGLGERVNTLTKHYHELLTDKAKVSHRLIKAFPTMKTGEDAKQSMMLLKGHVTQLRDKVKSSVQK